MKVAVLGASGRAGSEITLELSRRGHQVVAIARSPSAIPEGPNVIPTQGDAHDPLALAKLLQGCDAVISALRFDVPAAALVSAIKLAGVKRLLVTGGAGSLEVKPSLRLIDTPDFPEDAKPFVLGGITFLDALRDEATVNWTFFSPAAFLFEGPRLGHYRLGGDQLVTDESGASKISFADYALAMVDELETQAHTRVRFTAAY